MNFNRKQQYVFFHSITFMIHLLACYSLTTSSPREHQQSNSDSCWKKDKYARKKCQTFNNHFQLFNLRNHRKLIYFISFIGIQYTYIQTDKMILLFSLCEKKRAQRNGIEKVVHHACYVRFFMLANKVLG